MVNEIDELLAGRHDSSITLAGNLRNDVNFNSYP